MTLLRDSVLNILREAISRETGIVVRVESPSGLSTPVLRAKQVLYRFKSENSDFANLQIRISPDDPDNELWLINQNPNEPNPDPTETLDLDLSLDPA